MKSLNELIAKSIFEKELANGDLEWEFKIFTNEGGELLIVFLLENEYNSHYTSYEEVVKEFQCDLENWYRNGEELDLTEVELAYLGFEED